MSSLSFSKRKLIVSRIEKILSIRKEFASICSAFFVFFSPIRIPMVMEPPIPTNVPNEVRSVTIGPHTPAPASASVP